MELNCKFGVHGCFMQFWSIWGDAVADELTLPFDRISLEMIYRGLYHFTEIAS